MEVELTKRYNVLALQNQYVSAEDVKRNYQGIDQPIQHTFLGLFREFNEHMKTRVAIKDVTPRRAEKFVMLYERAQEFIQAKYKRVDLPLQEAKMNFIIQFEQFLRLTHANELNTSMRNAKEIKQVMKYGVTLEYLPNNPFANFKSVYRPPKRVFLTKEELDMLYQKEFTIKRLDRIRDCFLFSCYTGYAYKETESFTPDNLVTGIDGEKWIYKVRHKTDGIENVPLLPIAIEIINKYKKDPYCLRYNKLLPVVSNFHYNGYLKEIADLCGIKKNLTTHVARHTFATTVLLTNDVPIETAMELLGHKDIRTTQIYGKIVQ